MNIQGVQGMSPENIRDEINRGGRLVIHMYCVSILVMTFKRPTDIRLIKAGQSPAAAGWPYVLISFLFGWWGIPWGPIYTIECIYRNLCGGIDVTDEVLAQLLPAAPKAPPALSAQPAASAATPAPSYKLPPAPPSGFNPKVAGLMAAGVALVVFAGITLFCFYRQQHLTVVLASGLDRPYSVTLNGQTHELKPHGAEVLELPEGEFTLADAPGGRVLGAPRTFKFSQPFFDHLGTEQVVVLNPDSTAILALSDIPYYKDGTTPPADQASSYSLLLNNQFHSLPKPDFVIAPADERVSMPSGTTRVVKTRLENLEITNLPPVLRVIAEKSGYDAVRQHLGFLAQHRADEELLRAAIDTLKPADLPAFFRPRLAERPVLVEWHRYYQQAMDFTQPTHDLQQEYRGYLQAEPGNGALMYLLGRQVSDPAEASRLWEGALAANPPCAHAHGAKGFDALSEGRFQDAITHYSAAEQAGASGAWRKQSRRALHWALGQPAVTLPELATERKAAPLDLQLAVEEIRATLAANPDESPAQKLREAYLAAYRKVGADASNLKETDTYLQAVIAYQSGRLPAYAELVDQLGVPYYKFQAACTRGELKPAADALAKLPRQGSLNLMLLYIVAHRAGPADLAEPYFQQAIDALRSEGHEHRRAAELLAGPEPDIRALCELRIDTDIKRVLLTGFGLHQPAGRDRYFALAQRLNFNPEFPHHLLKQALASR